jgi:hypothetical protein
MPAIGSAIAAKSPVNESAPRLLPQFQPANGESIYTEATWRVNAKGIRPGFPGMSMAFVHGFNATSTNALAAATRQASARVLTPRAS